MALVRQARGLSSVAHPRFITQDRVRLRQVIQELRALGLDGVEAYHSHHDAEEQLYFIRLANQLGLMITGGSDYHGFKTKTTPADSGGKLGSLQLPYGFAVRLRRAYFHSYPTRLLLLQWPSVAAAAIRRAFETHYRLPSVRWSPPAQISTVLGSMGLERASRGGRPSHRPTPGRSMPSSRRAAHTACAPSACHGKRQVLKGTRGSTRRAELHPSGFVRRRWNGWPTSSFTPPSWYSYDEAR